MIKEYKEYLFPEEWSLFSTLSSMKEHGVPSSQCLEHTDENAIIYLPVKDILTEKNTGVPSDILLINAGAAFVYTIGYSRDDQRWSDQKSAARDDLSGKANGLFS